MCKHVISSTLTHLVEKGHPTHAHHLIYKTFNCVGMQT